MTFTEIAILLLVVLLGYVYLGYPLLLGAAAKLFPRPHDCDPAHAPTVTLVISAYNEAEVIGAKIENSLALDYPPELLSVVVVSDCSDDGTDEVVAGYASRGVRLVRAAQRRGKTSALNEAMRGIESEVVVFSDANAMYDRRAIRALVRHFADPRIGYVVGHARYREETETAAGTSEGAYWNLEVMIKKWESDFSSVVGGDGAIYAIRRALYEPMEVSDINDFVNPLQIVVKGYRGLFDPEAFCTEHPAGRFDKEFSRKVRIVNRSLNALFRVPAACLPGVTGRFAWQLVSHKVLRWFSPYIVALLVLALVLDWALNPLSLTDRVVLGLGGAFLLLAAAGRLQARTAQAHPVFYLPYYFLLMNLASARGVYLRLSGTTISTWTTVRQDDGERPAAPSKAPGILFAIALCAALLLLLGADRLETLSLCALLLLVALAHTFALYPALLLPMARLLQKRVGEDAGYTPEVTLLVTAYDEGGVLAAKLENSLALDYPRERLRIVVASDGSTDATNDIAARYAGRGVELIPFSRNRGKSAALSDAMRRIGSEIVIFSDANVNYTPDAVRKLVRHFADPRVGAVSGKVLLTNDTVSYGSAERTYYCLEHSIQEHEGMIGALVGADGAMYAVRRSLFTPPGDDTILDDLVIPMNIARGGHLVLHDKEALGYEENLLEVEGEFRRKARIMAGGYQCLLSGRGVPRLTQPLLLFCFISHKVLRWVSGLVFLALMAVLVRIEVQYDGAASALLTWLLALLGGSLLLALAVQCFPVLKRYRLANYCHYFFMLLLASLFGCYLGTTGRQRVNWRSEVA